MRLVSFEDSGGAARLGALTTEEGLVDLAAAEPELPSTMLGLLELGAAGMELARATLAAAAERGLVVPVAGIRLLSPLPRPNSIRDFMLVEGHASGGGRRELPPEYYEIPAYWKGNCDAVFGPEDEIRWPAYTEQLDYELELGAVLGARGRGFTPETAAGAIAGYTIFNDWSARDIQRREMKVGLGPGLGKDFASSFGPCLTTPDEFAGLSARMVARVNGEVWSDGNLEDMRMSFEELVVHLSGEQELQPGDILGSGTISGGCGAEFGRYLEPGDLVELSVESIGTLRNRVGRRSSE